MSYTWRFNTRRRCDKRREPIQGEFFAADAISNPGEALVREGIQNSLDARRNGERVLVRIHVSGESNAIDRKALTRFLDGLETHLRAPGNGLREIPTTDENCPVLVFEDFGTTGLLGDPEEVDPPHGTRNHFYHFFRAEGQSGKGEQDRGRWGVGKQVFPRASRINSIFGLTVRHDDRKKLLMGMAVLKSHDVTGIRYAPDGWLGNPSEEGEEELILPIDAPDFIEQFSTTFDVQRGGEPGLTIVVPWCDLDITDENLLRAVLRGYFWPILRGQLEVIVEARKIETILDANSLRAEVKKIGGDLEREILPLCELGSWANMLHETDFVTLHIAQGWKWSKDIFPSECLTGLREKFDRGDRIAIRVPLAIAEKGGEARSTHFDVFLFRDGAEQTGRPVYIREGIIIPDVRRYGSGALRGVRSLVVAEDGPVAAFLGDSENPAHTQWQKDGANFKGKYEEGSRILEFITHSAIEIVRIINEQDKKEDRTLLVDLFSIPVPAKDDYSQIREKKAPQHIGTEPDTPTPPESRPRAFVIDRVESGFVIRGDATNGTTQGCTLLIRAAYHVRRGNPFKKYNPADFDLSQRMRTQLKGSSLLEKGENVLRVRIDSSDFRIEVTGFDSKRDLRVDVRRQEDNDARSDS